MKRKNVIILVLMMLAMNLAGCGNKTAVIAPKSNISMDGISAFDENIQSNIAAAESIDEPYTRSFALYSVPEYEYSAKVINPGNPLILEVRTTVPGWNFCSSEFTLMADGKELFTNNDMNENDIYERVIYDSVGVPVDRGTCSTTTSALLALNSVDIDLTGKNISIHVPASYTDDTEYEAEKVVHEMDVEVIVEGETEQMPVQILSGKSFVKICGEWYQTEVDNEIRTIPHGSCMYICRDIRFVPFSNNAEISLIHKPTVTLADKDTCEKIDVPETIGITRTFDNETNTLSVIVNPYIATENESAEVLVEENYIMLQ